ncbi:MAG: DinB family protein [Chloroflexi bacterium]|nr:DinB family protein [Chloroflexota bacterium]MBI3339961.1 DinB family protein [Chloroflexota bacterium]
MNIQDILLIYEYNYWANKRILAQCKNVTHEQFTAPAEFPYGGLRGTIVHILDAEFGWRMFFKNNDWSAPELKEIEFPTFALVQERADKEEKEMRAYLAVLRDEDMNAHKHYRTEKGGPRDRILWHCLLHLVNHGTQHRSEAAALLTRFGQSPGDLDFTMFLNGYKP